MKVLLISDKPNWAYSTIANAIIKYNKSDILFSHLNCKKDLSKIKNTYKEYDYFFVLGWQNLVLLPFLDKHRVLTGVHSHQSFDQKQTTPESDFAPSKNTIDFLGKFRAVNTVSKRLYNLLIKNGLSITYTPNGVDTNFFIPGKRNNSFIISSASASKNDWNKGVKEFIIPVCQTLSFPVIYADGKLKHTDMVRFYNSSHCYVCMSKSEGMSLSVLEAASCGCIIISTECGDIKELINHEQNGFIIERSKDELTRTINKICFNRELINIFQEKIRETVVKSWDWSKRVDLWVDFIRGNCN